MAMLCVGWKLSKIEEWRQSSLHGAMTQKIAIFILTAMRTSVHAETAFCFEDKILKPRQELRETALGSISS
jgi:hypothetical protein